MEGSLVFNISKKRSASILKNDVLNRNNSMITTIIVNMILDKKGSNKITRHMDVVIKLCRNLITDSHEYQIKVIKYEFKEGRLVIYFSNNTTRSFKYFSEFYGYAESMRVRNEFTSEQLQLLLDSYEEVVANFWKDSGPHLMLCRIESPLNSSLYIVNNKIANLTHNEYGVLVGNLRDSYVQLGKDSIFNISKSLIDCNDYINIESLLYRNKLISLD